MKILLVTGYFPPEMAAAPNLNYELAQQLKRLGHSVTVATGFPRYNLKEIPSKYKRKLHMREMMDGVVVERTWSPNLPRHNFIARGIEIFLMAFALLWSVIRAGKHDVASIFSPPLTTGLTAVVARKIYGYPFVYNVHDIFPQNVIDLGVMKNRVLIRFFQRMERFIYERSNYVTVISSGNRDCVVKSGARADHTVVVPDWVDTDVVVPGNRQNSFSELHGLNDKFVVSYCGVMGYSQDLDTVLEAARILKTNPRIHFLFVGDGVEKKRLQALSAASGLTNVQFLPMMSADEVRLVFQSSDVCLATLRASVKTPPVPSKIVWAMATARPVITCLNLDGDAPKLLRSADCGISVPPENPSALAEAILNLAANASEVRRLGLNGREYAVRKLSSTAAADRLVALFQDMIGGSTSPCKVDQPVA